MSAGSRCEIPGGVLAVRLYNRMITDSEVAQFFAPEAECHDSGAACEFLRALADEMEAYRRKEYPDGLPF